MKTKTYHERVFEEVAKMLIDNLELIYTYDDKALLSIRKYCIEKCDEEYKPLDYNTLVYFVEEILREFADCDFYYDFRDLDNR